MLGVVVTVHPKHWRRMLLACVAVFFTVSDLGSILPAGSDRWHVGYAARIAGFVRIVWADAIGCALASVMV